MRILILGGDGYLGWPTAMHLSQYGHVVAVVDNYLHRRLARETDSEPLLETLDLPQRCQLWRMQTGLDIHPHIGDLCNWDFMSKVLSEFGPDAIVHYAEQPSAPYSMFDRAAATLTLSNNLAVTSNLVFGVRQFCPNAHIVKLGTMGEYGTPNIDIEEGWLDITHNGRADRFLYPRQGSSLYHTTKIMDTDLLWFYVRTWGLAVTDIMQGPVYGLFTNEAGKNEQLLPRFSYDDLFGTVINRFVVQAVAGHPLTVYGKGGQTRGYINIIDTVNCIRITIENPAKNGEMRIFNQITEVFTINDLATRVAQAGEQAGLKVEVNHLQNPRIEKEEHYYNPKHSGLVQLGFKPHLLEDSMLADMIAFVKRNRDAIAEHRIFRNTKWA